MKINIVIIGVLVIVITTMAVAYSVLSTQLNLNGTTTIINRWNIRIESISAQYISENCVASQPQVSNMDITFNVELHNPGDYITYLVIIDNAGIVNGVLNDITFEIEENEESDFICTYSEPDTLLMAGRKTFFLVMIQYDEHATEIATNPKRTVKGHIEYIEQMGT